MKDRVILHCDINNCYAAISELHHPKLRGLPVAVGGDVEQRHGIILAKNYEAKPYGIKVGQALWEAKQLCPDLVIIPPEFDLYMRFSRMFREIMSEYSDQIEPFGLDELWADVTGSLAYFGCTGEELAHTIRERVKFELGVTISIGVSWNKIFAKLGSDYKKPDAVTAITRENFRDIVWNLPVADLLGVGKATEGKLRNYGITTIGDIARADEAFLAARLGKWGEILHSFANGNDTSPVQRLGNEAMVKSVGNSTTTPRDLVNEQDCKIVFYNLAESVAARLRELGLKGHTIQISLRDNQLVSFERQKKLTAPTNLATEITDTAMELLCANYTFKNPLRSIGVRATGLVPAHDCYQISMFADEEARKRQEVIERTTDELRRRFGYYSINIALMMLDPMLGKLNAKGDNIIHPVGYFG